MLPTNVMSFVKKIVSSSQNADDGFKDKGSASKSRSLVMSPIGDGQSEKTAQSPVPESADMSHLTAEEISILQKVFQKQQQFEKEEATRKKPDSNIKPISRSNACRICLKGLVATDIFHVCCECQQKVCEDCSSYSKQDVSKDKESWMCSICRRKLADQQKILDPDALSRIARRESMRKVSGNGTTLLPATLNPPVGPEEIINTTPKLRPNTLDTTCSHLGPVKGLDPNAQPWNELRDRLKSPIGIDGVAGTRDANRRPKDHHHHHHHHHHRHHLGEPSSNSAPQTPNARSGGRTFQQDRYETRDRNRKYSTTGLRLYNSESEDSKKRLTRSPERVDDGDQGEAEETPEAESSTTSTAPTSGHPALRHVHSDSSSLVAKYRLSPDIHKERHSKQRQSPSTSDSSLEESWREEVKAEHDHWRRKKSKVKRRSRIQRQRSCHDDLEAERGQPDQQGGQRPHGGANKEDSGEASLDDYGRSGDFQCHPRDHLLDVPGHSRIFRHHSWDASLSARRYSSESSDVSDVGADYPGSLDQDELMDDGPDASASMEHSLPARLNFLRPRVGSTKKLARKKPVESEDDYDAEQSANVESSPSPDNLEKHPFPHMERRTSSEDSDVFKGSYSRRSSQNSTASLSMTNWPGKIPIVEVHAAEHDVVAGDVPDSKVDVVLSAVAATVERSSSGRSLPKIPSQSIRLTPVPAPRTRQSKSVDLTPLCTSERGQEILLRRSTLADFESVKIVIDDVDSDHLKDKNKKVLQRKVILSRLPDDSGLRSTLINLETRGFGMRVVGGKIGEDGRLFAYVVWTVPDGPAELSGIVKGDKILEWDGESLVDRTFEEVCSIMDHSGDEVTLVIEHVVQGSSVRHGSFDNGHIPDHIIRRCSEGTGLDILAAESQKNELQPTRRRLPKPPELSQDVISGEVQLVVWYDPEQPVLTVTVVEAQDLPLRTDNKTPPESYAKVRLLPEKNNSSFKTPVADPSSNPTWNESFNYAGIGAEEILEKFLVVSVWDIVSSMEKRSLGEVVLQLRKCEMDGRAEWYRLRDRRSLLTMANSAPKLTSTKCLLPPQTLPELQDLHFKRKELQTRSMSDDIDEQMALELIGHMVKSTSVDSNLLHPEQAWNRDRRRSSSGSEKSDTSTHSCPQSLPSTRKNSFNADPSYYDQFTMRDRHRARSFKIPRHELLKGHQENDTLRTITKTSEKLGRSFSLKADKRSLSLVNVSDSAMVPSSSFSALSFHFSKGDQQDDHHHHSDVDDDAEDGDDTPQARMLPKDYLAPPSRSRWSSNSSLDASDDDENGSLDHVHDPNAMGISQYLGPGQVSPKHFTGNLGSNPREVKLGLIISKGFMEIDVICARGIGMSTSGQPPDTYVKTYLKEGEKRLQKKKTRVIRHAVDPQYRQTLRYPASEVNGRFLLVMVWERQKGFDHNHGIGVAQINPDKLELNKLVIGWYRLFPMAKIESESNEST